jgi:hypothetical protein
MIIKITVRPKNFQTYIQALLNSQIFSLNYQIERLESSKTKLFKIFHKLKFRFTLQVGLPHN